LGDDDPGAALVQIGDDPVGIKGLVGDQGIEFNALDQRRHTDRVVPLAGQQDEAHQIAQRIDERDNLGRQAASGAADSADFRRDNGLAICAACAQFIVICRDLGLINRPLAAIDGSKFKGVNAATRTSPGARSGRGLPSWRRARLSISPRLMRPTARRAWQKAAHPPPASCATSLPGSRRRCRS
jgi:hypothetical protein